MKPPTTARPARHERLVGEVVVGVNLAEWKRWAERLKSETYALYLAYGDPRMPWYAKLFAALVVGYAFSPIDLIPDAIPILGYLDDLILVPLGVALTVRMIPKDVLSESRQRAQKMVEKGERPVSRAAAVVIVVLWLALAVLGVLIVVRMVGG